MKERKDIRYEIYKINVKEDSTMMGEEGKQKRKNQKARHSIVHTEKEVIPARKCFIKMDEV
jgi:hypothetical protein